MDSKYTGAQVEQWLEIVEKGYGSNSISGLGSLPVDKNLLVGINFTATALTFQKRMAEGQSIHIIIPKGMTTAAVTVPLPNGQVTNDDGTVSDISSNMEAVNVGPDTTTEINIISIDGLSCNLIAVTY